MRLVTSCSGGGYVNWNVDFVVKKIVLKNSKTHMQMSKTHLDEAGYAYVITSKAFMYKN